MVQNRNKFIELFIGNISNVVVHEILEMAVGKQLIADRYRKELITSFEVAKRYREKINPTNRLLSDKDVNYIRNKIINKVRAELMIRISKGYKNIDVNLIEKLVDMTLKNMNIT